MDLRVHRAEQRGRAEHGWLHSRFSFSFADYRDLRRMGFGVLRVINDDVIEPGQGFGMHPHRDMEIITIVMEGALEHRDSEGNHGIIHAGQIQYMSAGSGVSHSEYNPSSSDNVHLFQIWVHPDHQGATPRYAQHDFLTQSKSEGWMMLVSPDGQGGAIAIRQDASIALARPKQGSTLMVEDVASGHGRLLLVIEGEISALSETLGARDELQVTGHGPFDIMSKRDALLLLFDVPMR